MTYIRMEEEMLRKGADEPRDTIQFVGTIFKGVLKDALGIISNPKSTGESLGIKRLRELLLKDYCSGNYKLIKTRRGFLELVGNLLINHDDLQAEIDSRDQNYGKRMDEVNDVLYELGMTIQQRDRFVDDLERVRGERNEAQKDLMWANGEMHESLGRLRKTCMLQGKTISEIIQLAKALQEMDSPHAKLISDALLKIAENSPEVDTKDPSSIKKTIRALRDKIRRATKRKPKKQPII